MSVSVCPCNAGISSSSTTSSLFTQNQHMHKPISISFVIHICVATVVEVVKLSPLSATVVSLIFSSPTSVIKSDSC